MTNEMFPSVSHDVSLQKRLVEKSKKIWESPTTEDVKDLYLLFNLQGTIKKKDQFANEKQNKGKR